MIRSAAFALALLTVAPAAEAQVAAQEPSPSPDEVFVIEPPAPPAPPPPVSSGDGAAFADLEAGWLEVHAFGGWASLDHYELGAMPSERAPDPLAGRALLLDGTGAMLGGGVRFGYQSDDGVRFGAGFGGHTIEGLRLQGGSLPGGVVASLEQVVALRGELVLGKAFDAGPLWPYVEAVVSVNGVTAEIALDTPQHGFVGETTYGVLSATVAPRLGLFIPLSDATFLDIAGQYGLFGVERGALLVGLGVWDD